MQLEVTTSDGKYTIRQYDNGEVEVLRYKEVWKHATGDKCLLQFGYDLDDVREKLNWVIDELEKVYHVKDGSNFERITAGILQKLRTPGIEA